MTDEQIKAVISAVDTFEEADEIIEKCTEYRTPEDKIKFLQNLFDCAIVGRAGGDDSQLDYVVLLTSIVDRKWY